MPVVRPLLACCLFVIAAPAWAQSQDSAGWTVLSNQAGAEVDFPAALFPHEKTDPERRVFATADGRSTFQFFSIPNVKNEPPAQFAKKRAERPEDNITYKRVAGNFLAASAKRNGRILYRRCNFANRMIHCIGMQYPASQKRQWDAIVTRISLSLRPLSGPVSR